MTKEPDEPILMIDEYRSFVGRLLFYVKKVAFECTNAIRELSQFLSHPTETHWKSLTRLMCYIKYTSYGTFKIRRPKNLEVISFIDISYAPDKDDRKSVTGGVLTMGGQLVHIFSRKQASVTLSTTEAEYVAMTTMAQEILFLQALLKDIVPLIYPAVILKDNTGAIFLAENQHVNQRTKHIDIRAHFLRALIPTKLVICYVRSENNYGDALTKHLPGTKQERFTHHIHNGTIKVPAGDVPTSPVNNREDVNKKSEEILFCVDPEKLSPSHTCDRNPVLVMEGHNLLVPAGQRNEKQNKPNGSSLCISSHCRDSRWSQPRPDLVLYDRPLGSDPGPCKHRQEPWEDHWSDPPGCDIKG